MGLLDYLKTQFLEIIQWQDDSRDTCPAKTLGGRKSVASYGHFQKAGVPSDAYEYREATWSAAVPCPFHIAGRALLRMNQNDEQSAKHSESG